MALRATDLIHKKCLTCFSKFETQYRNLFRGRGKFCSKKCSNKNDINRKSKREKQLDRGEGKRYRKFYGKEEHRILMEEILNRKLIKNEVVHHIDGNRRNNNKNNLMVYSSNAEHLRDHFLKNYGKCLIKDCLKKNQL